MLGEDEQQAAHRVIASGALAQGPEVAAFEAEFSELVAGRTCVAVNSGTSALHLALLALGIGPGDEVVVPAFTFAATVNAVRLAGAEPVFADIDAATFCVEPDAVAAVVTPRTAAIMPVHLYGHPAAMPALCAVAARHGLAIVEDAAQAHGAQLDGRPVGAWGAAAAFSFYPTKNMTCGEGGMVVLEDAAAARNVRLLRNQGMERQYENEIVGYNLRMTDLAAAIGRVQLRRLAGFNEARRRHAAILSEAIGAGVSVPAVAPGAEHVYHQFTITHDERDLRQAHLAGVGIESRVYYPTPVHRLPVNDDGRAALPRTDEAARTVLSLPVGPHLDDGAVARVADAVAGWRAA
jgi:dTDP-4-amino-4,6-dideoxygalactose transaminase